MIRDWMALPGVRAYFRDRGSWYTVSFLRYVQDAANKPLDTDGNTLMDHYGDAGV